MTEPKKYTCDIVEVAPVPGLTFRDMERKIIDEHFRDYGEYKSRYARLVVDAPDGDRFYFDMLGEKGEGDNGGPITGMKEAVVRDCTLMGWIPGAPPDDEMLEKFKRLPEAKAVRGAIEDLMDVECTDRATLEAKAGKVGVAWSDFLVKAAPLVFQSEFYYQLRWMQIANHFQDTMDCDLRPLDRIPLLQMKAYMAASRDRCKEQIFNAPVIDLKARKALQDVQRLFDRCLDQFNQAALNRAAFSAIHPGELGVLIQNLVETHNLLPKNQNDSKASSKPAP